MSPQVTDEETPLLQPRHTDRTPLPWAQFSIVLFLQATEPLTFHAISPFTPQLIRDIGVTCGDETQVAYYVGLLQSILSGTQALTALPWSWLSDYIGRKPVIMIGVFGMSASMYCFGLSKTFWGLALSRTLIGLNGVGAIKSMIAEMTDSTNLAHAFAYVPLAWSIGISLGPLIGGSLSNPADRFPGIFGDWGFFKEYPYFLACAVPGTIFAISLLVALVFMKETRRDPVSLSELIRAQFDKTSVQKSVQSTPHLSSRAPIGEEPLDTDETPLPLCALLIPRVLTAVGNYGALSVFEIGFRSLQPVFFATPVELGGLGLDPPRIGNILFVRGALNGLFQALFFARVHDRFGPKAVYSAIVASTIPLVLTFPLLNALTRAQGLSWVVWSAVGLHVFISAMLNAGFSCLFIFIAASSPNQASLGATNGIAQLLSSVMRTIGPAAAASMFSLSIKSPERAWLVYDFLLVLAGIAVGASWLLPRRPWRRSTD